MTRGDLKTAINSNTHRTHTDADLERHIEATSIAIGRDAQLFKQEQSVTVTSTVDGLAPADIASDFLIEVTVYYDDGTCNVSLKKLTTQQANAHFYGAAHAPIGYYWEGGKLKLVPYQEQELVVVYKQRIPALATDGDTHIFLTEWPEVFEFGATYRAALQFQDDDIINKYLPLYNEEINKLRKFSVLQQYSGTSIKTVS